ncbi:MAG: hypothetical protein NT036_03160 [Candidatus Omnitrophica bacterium]|nr:hypothetical protein [Candidatus Omnitrophota bacterium]
MKRDRVLLSAILFSAIWHLFWLSALTVVVVPKDTKPPKFSSVSFLGPILETSMLGVSSVAHERSIPEKRYLSEIEDPSVLIGDRADPDAYIEAGFDAGTDIFRSDETLTALAVSAIDGDKIEPGNSQ